MTDTKLFNGHYADCDYYEACGEVLVGCTCPPVTAPLTRETALAQIDRIFQMAGYAEADGDVWLGPALMHLRDYISKETV